MSQGITIQRVSKPQSEGQWLTVFTETENGSFISRGNKDKTCIVRSEEGGWISMKLDKDAEGYDEEDKNATKYITAEEAMKAVSNHHGFLVDYLNREGMSVFANEHNERNR